MLEFRSMYQNVQNYTGICHIFVQSIIIVRTKKKSCEYTRKLLDITGWNEIKDHGIVHNREHLRKWRPTKGGLFSGLSVYMPISPLSIFFDLLACWLASVNMIYE